MFKDEASVSTPKSLHLDEMKGISEPMFIRTYFETLLDENVFPHATLVVNMFAGNCNESMLSKEYLQKVGNTNCKIVAVDKTPPTWQGNKKELEESMGEKFQFVTADVIDYLKTLPDNSVDVFTAFGAEYVFRQDQRPQVLRTYVNELKRVMKIGGYIVSPLVTVPREDSGFERINPAVRKKVSNQPPLPQQ